LFNADLHIYTLNETPSKPQPLGTPHWVLDLDLDLDLEDSWQTP